MNVKISEIIDCIETIAPNSYQESYDNAGLIIGNKNDIITGVTICLDITEEVIDEAITNKDNLIIAHHPIIFKGIKKITGSNYVERCIIKAIQHNIALFAAHTNLDSVIENGVNSMIAQKIGLLNCKILSPKLNSLKQLITTIPKVNTEDVMEELHRVGAGNIGNYKNCSFRVLGTGHFRPVNKAKPTIGTIEQDEIVEEIRVELIFPAYLEQKILKTLKDVHPYEEVAYFITSLENYNQDVGSGMIGDLEKPIPTEDFFHYLKKEFKLQVIKHTSFTKKTIQKVAFCGGSGSFLIKNAIEQEADIYITGDIKYHDFFDADNKIILVDIGHFESEIHTKDLFFQLISSKYQSLDLHICKTNTNPVQYYF